MYISLRSLIMSHKTSHLAGDATGTIRFYYRTNNNSRCAVIGFDFAPLKLHITLVRDTIRGAVCSTSRQDTILAGFETPNNIPALTLQQLALGLTFGRAWCETATGGGATPLSKPQRSGKRQAASGGRGYLQRRRPHSGGHKR